MNKKQKGLICCSCKRMMHQHILFINCWWYECYVASFSRSSYKNKCFGWGYLSSQKRSTLLYAYISRSYQHSFNFLRVVCNKKKIQAHVIERHCSTTYIDRSDAFLTYSKCWSEILSTQHENFWLFVCIWFVVV